MATGEEREVNRESSARPGASRGPGLRRHLRRRWVRALLAAPLVVTGIAMGPSKLVERWTGLEESSAVALLLVGIAASLWITEAIPLFATSFVLLLLELVWLMPTMQAAGFEVDSTRFLAPFFSNVVLLFLGGFAMSTAFRKYLLDRWIANRVLERTGGEPRAVLAAVIGITAFLSMWMSNTATSAMMLGLAMPLLGQTAADDPYRRALPLGIAFGANLGGLGTPIGTPPNAIVIDALGRIGEGIGFATWMAMATPLLLLLLGVTWVLTLRMYPPHVVRLEMDTDARVQVTGRSRLVVLITLTTAALWLTSGLHPWATGTVALLPVATLFGLRLLDRSDFQGLPWDVLMLAGGGLSLGAAVESSGLGEAIVASIPVAALGEIGLIAALALVAAVMTTFMSNTATANLLVPVVAGLSDAARGPLLVAVAYACSCTMVLPVSTPPNAMAFSSGQITTRDLVRPALWLSGLALVLTALVAPHWWRVLGIR